MGHSVPLYLGPLTIVNSSMATLAWLANLENVATKNQLTTFNGRSYEIVVSGWLRSLVVRR